MPQQKRNVKKPKHYDRNIIVIGGGAAGLVCAYIGATLKASISLIEKHKMGGDCLNTGCVPSKALIRSAKLLHQMRNAEHYGLPVNTSPLDFTSTMQRVRRVIESIAPHDSRARYQALGVDCIAGEARLLSPYAVAINEQILTAKNIIIASGAVPSLPPIPGIAQIDCLTSENVWSLQQQPKRLLVLGGGPIGCELAQSFARLGSQVTLVEMLPRLLAREDAEVSALLHENLQREGVHILTANRAEQFYIKDGETYLRCRHNTNDQNIEIPFDRVLVATGRKARTTGFGLQELGIACNANDSIQVNDYMQTNYTNIYACGDVTGQYQFTHVAAHQAWYCTVNALLRPFKKFKVDYRIIPWCTFTDPEVARVGLNETEAQAQGIPYETTVYRLDELDRTIIDGNAQGFVKVLTVPGKDKMLGATLVGEHAGDLIAEYVLAMKHNIGLNKILNTIHIYPTLAEANKYAAGAWKRAHAPYGLLRLLQRWHRWRLH